MEQLLQEIDTQLQSKNISEDVRSIFLRIKTFLAERQVRDQLVELELNALYSSVNNHSDFFEDNMEPVDFQKWIELSEINF